MNILRWPLPLFAPEDGYGAAPAPSAPAGPSSAGGEASPSSAPASGASPSASPSPSTVSHEVPNDPDDFSFDRALDESIEVPDDPQPVVKPPPALPVQEAQPLQPQPPQAPPATQATPPAPATQAAPPSGPQPHLDLTNPRVLATELARNEQALVDAVAQEHFVLSDAEKEAFEADPVGMLPKLGARVFLRSQQVMLAQMDRLLPRMMQQHIEVLGRSMAGKNQFYAAHPGIDRLKHDTLVDQWARTLRSQNPHMPREQFIPMLGRVIGALIGPQPQAAPASARAPNGAPARATPFVPAGGAPPSGSGASMDDNPWEGMGRDYET